MRKSVMNMRIFCVAVGLMTAGTWAQVPIFKLRVTEVYEVNPDGTYTAKCGVNCDPPHGTQDLLPGIAQPGDLINIEVTVEGWDADMDAGECSQTPEGQVPETCSISAQDCDKSHCTGATSGVCTDDKDCFFPGICNPDRCDKSPLVGAFQWTIDSSTYSNGGAGPGLAPAQLPCTTDADCKCAYTEVTGNLNDCADFAACCSFCTCVSATCEDNTCSATAAAYIDFSVIPGYLYFQHNSFRTIDFSTLNYAFGGFSSDNPSGVPEELFRCTGGNRSICNVDADCDVGMTCELIAAPPYYLGTLLLEATGESCGLFTLDLDQEFFQGVAIATSLTDSNAQKLPNPIVETLFIDLGTAVPCNDGDLCTENDEFCGGNPEFCAGTPKICPPGETCILGECTGGCTFADVTDATWADADPLSNFPFHRPGDCAIDAREPHSINDANAKEGWDRLVLKFSCDPTDLASRLRPASFAVETDPVELSPPFIPAVGGFEANQFDRTLTIHLDRNISPAFYTCITHLDSGNGWCAGYLPADASQDGLSAAGDINALINSINLVPGLELPIYATDINRSGVTTGADILRLIDLLNGAGDFTPWIAQGLPDCPSAP